MTDLVLQSEWSDEYGPHWIAATPFGTLDDAKKYLKHVVNDEWGAIVLEHDDGCVFSAKLGDHPGYKYPVNSTVKHSFVYFDEDGMEAWDEMSLSKKIKIVKVGKEGERVC